MPEVEIFTKRYCPYCRLAKSILEQYHVAYSEYDVSEDPDLFEQMVIRAKGRRTVPQIFIDGLSIGGADELSLLQEQGRLLPLLRKSGTA